MNSATTPPKRSTALVVGGVITAILATGLLVVGGALIWADHKKDDDGYLTTTTHRFSAPTAALATRNLDVNLDGADWVVSENHLGKVRLKVDSERGKPVFVGIARTRDVTSYLRGVAHTTITDVDYAPFKAGYEGHPGAATAALPGDRHFWSASAQGSGRQTVTWKVRKGNWSVVVMNADGSRGVAADISAGADLPFVTPLAWGTFGTGALLAAAAAGMLLAGDRRRRRSPERVVAAPAPAAV